MTSAWATGLLTGLLSISALGNEKSVADVYHLGEESLWVIEQAEERIGTSWSRYEGVVELLGLRAHLFRGQVELVLKTPDGILVHRFASDLWTDDSGHPRRFLLQTKTSDVYGQVAGLFADGKVALKVQQGPSQSELERDAPADSYLLANNFLGHLELILALEEGASRQYTIFSPNTLAVFPLTVDHEEVHESGAAYRDSLGERLILADVPVLYGHDGGLPAPPWSSRHRTFSKAKHRRLSRVEIPAQAVVFRRVTEGYNPFDLEPPPLPEPASDLESEDVRIEEKNGSSIAGTITKKKGSSGRQPALFFISGSGGQDRNGFAAGIDLGTHEILDHLTREGFLVLRVDDHGVGETWGGYTPLEELPFDALVADARLAVSHLRGRSDVDPTRIALIGHSEGAMSAVLIAESTPEIAAIVLMAGPGRPFRELLTEQLLSARRKRGAAPDELAELEAEIASFLSKVEEGKTLDPAALPPELAAFVLLNEATWVASHLRQDPLANLRKVGCPVLILQGEQDLQVSAERDAPLVLAALKEAGNTDCSLVIFPGLDHLFKRVPGETPSELDFLKSRPIAPEFLETLSTWLRSRLIED